MPSTMHLSCDEKRTRQVAARGCGWTHPILRSAHEHLGADAFSVPSRLALASLVVAAKPDARPQPNEPSAWAELVHLAVSREDATTLRIAALPM